LAIEVSLTTIIYRRLTIWGFVVWLNLRWDGFGQSEEGIDALLFKG
jgi:hypothetical protein